MIISFLLWQVEVESATTPLPNEKGLQEKKRKLHASLDRVMKYWVSFTETVTQVVLLL